MGIWVLLSAPMGAWGTHVPKIVPFGVLNLPIGSFISCLVKMASSYQMGKFYIKKTDIFKGLWFRAHLPLLDFSKHSVLYLVPKTHVIKQNEFLF